MKILFDALGGDKAPLEIVKGAIEASKELGVEVAFVGDKNKILDILSNMDVNGNFEIIDAIENIENNEEPAFAIRKKPNSSIVLGLKELKKNNFDAFVSAGSTGALLAGGIFICGRIKNISRPVLPTPIPNIKGHTILVDSGANMDCDENLLLQFAIMGTLYLKSLGVLKPKVALLNVGTEKGKGNFVAKKAYIMLENSSLNFIGNIEARDISSGVADLIVCDGFVGNLVLKSIEGTASLMINSVKSFLSKSEFTEESLVDINNMMKTISKNLDYKEVGGVLLLGINKIIIKAHGSSDARAIKNAAKSAYRAFNENIIENLNNEFEGRNYEE